VMASAADGRKPLQDAIDQDACDGGFGGITSLCTLRKPLVAAINGAAVGGGFELALACDLIMMAEHAYFQLPEMQRGFLPDGGGIQRLPRRIPHNVAVEMILTGRRMEAVEARQWGLVRTVCEAGDLVRHAKEVTDEIAKGAPLALQAFKEVLAAIDGMPVAEAMDFQRSDALDLPLYRKMAASDDAIEGPRAFLERRRPNWTGR